LGSAIRAHPANRFKVERKLSKFSALTNPNSINGLYDLMAAGSAQNVKNWDHAGAFFDLGRLV